MSSYLNPQQELPELEGKRILITGGAGFIGSALAERLVARNQVVLFDRTFEAQSAPLSSAWGHANLETIVGDVLDPVAVEVAVEGADVVVHLAAIVGVKSVLSRGRETIEVNFIGTSNVLKAVAGRSDLHRFVYFSTSEVVRYEFLPGRRGHADLDRLGERGTLDLLDRQVGRGALGSHLPP